MFFRFRIPISHPPQWDGAVFGLRAREDDGLIRGYSLGLEDLMPFERPGI